MYYLPRLIYRVYNVLTAYPQTPFLQRSRILATKTTQFKHGHYESELMKSKLRETLGKRPWFSMHFRTKARENIVIIVKRASSFDREMRVLVF